MKKWMNVILSMVMVLICSVTMVQPAFAAEQPAVSVPIAISLSGTLPDQAEDFTIKMEADDVSFPMPEGSVDGVYTMTIQGAGTKNTPDIAYHKVGIYTYTIYQVPGTNAKCTYDDTVYTLTVYITNAEDGNGLESTAVLYPDSKEEKISAAEFKNEYEIVPDPTPEATPTPEPTPTPNVPTKTGDGSPLFFYSALLVVSMLGIVYMVQKQKKVRE